MILRFAGRALWALLWLVFLSMLGCNGCGGALPSASDCPPPSEVMASPDLLRDAEVVSLPDGCVCDAPLRCAVCSSNVGWCSYTFEAWCQDCVIDVTWKRGTPP